MAATGAFRASLRRLARSANAQAPPTSLPASADFISSLPSIGRTKLSTGIVGLPVHPSPFAHLVKLYDDTLATLNRIPPGAVYRQSVEAVIRQRRQAVAPYLEIASGEGVEQTIAKVEEQLGSGLIEEIVNQAEDEKALAEKMVEWKACVLTLIGTASERHANSVGGHTAGRTWRSSRIPDSGSTSRSTRPTPLLHRRIEGIESNGGSGGNCMLHAHATIAERFTTHNKRG